MLLNGLLIAAFSLLVLAPLVVATVVMMRADSGQAPVSLGAFGPTLSGAFIGSLLGVFIALTMATAAPTIAVGTLAMFVAMATTIGLVVGFALAPHREGATVPTRTGQTSVLYALEDAAA